MKTIVKKKINRLRAAKALIILIPILSMTFFTTNVIRLYKKTVQFSYDYKPDPSSFIPANYTLLNEMALFYDYRYENYHIPLNTTCNTIFNYDSNGNINYSDVREYKFSDNCAEWTSTPILAYVFKYQAGVREHNETLKKDALRVLRKLAHGLSMLMAVPNGGLGSNYSGILARGYAPPNCNDTVPGVDFYYNENIRHFNGTGKYSNYRWRGYTSNDEFGGFYMGLALLLKYVAPLDPYVKDLTYKMIDQICNYMILTDFQGISGSGAPSGVTQKPRGGVGGFWIPLLLKLGALTYPEKYEKLYYRSITTEQYYKEALEGGDQEVIANYYAFTFSADVELAFLILEGLDSDIGKHYYQGYLNSMGKFAITHRNAYYNSILLFLTNGTDTLTPAEREIFERDIEDQLMRFRINHFPDVFAGIKPVNDSIYKPVKEIEELNELFENDPYGALYQVAFLDVDGNFTAEPLTVEYINSRNMIWVNNPFEVPKYEILMPEYELPGFSFTIPYWMGRALGYIQPSGYREPYSG